MRYLIIGLGIYGSNLARDLVAQGHEVIGADINRAIVDDLKDDLSTVYNVDSTDPGALDVLPFANVDLVIVAIGENFGASIKTVALLRQKGVKKMYARAIDPLHRAILECFDLNRILAPEQRAASDLADEMLTGAGVMSMQLCDDLYVLNFQAPGQLEGHKYIELHLDSYGLQLVAATRPRESHNLIGVATDRQQPVDMSGDSVQAHDRLTCIGPRKALSRLIKGLS